VHGKPRHPQSQGSVERANGDIKDMLITWMRENPSKSWAIGLKFVQFAKNNSYHYVIKRSPYKAMFGCDAKIGLSTTSLPPEILASLESEDDPLAHLKDPESETGNSSQADSEFSCDSQSISTDEEDCDKESQTTDDEACDTQSQATDEVLTTDDGAQMELHAEDAEPSSV